MRGITSSPEAAEDGPHLCEVDNDEHYAQFPCRSAKGSALSPGCCQCGCRPLTANQSAPAFAPKDPYADLVVVDPGTVSNEWLHGFPVRS